MNLKNNGLNTIVNYGYLPDSYYSKIKKLPFTFITSNTDENDLYIEDAVPYHSSTTIISCSNISHFEISLRQVIDLPYWYPPANIIVLYHKQEKKKEEIAKILFILWYYRASNGILVQYDDTKKYMNISQYNPFVVDDRWDNFGCWTARTIGMPVNKFEDAFVCEEKCHNVSINSIHRRLRLGTCMGLQTHTIHYDDVNALENLNLFEDRAKNMNGFALRTFATESLFFKIKQLENGTYELGSRDGTIWKNLARLMNFSMDFTPSADSIKKKFNFEVAIQQIFTVAHRKGDLFPSPIYQFDIVVVELDYSFAYKDSGVCFMSHKAPFETVLFDFINAQHNIDILIEFYAAMICIWLVFSLYSAMEADKITLDLIGKSFMNTLRIVLSITLYKSPKKQTFRIFLTIIAWSFFLINFATQAAITSFFTAFKRGKEVETFADIVEKGYRIQGMSSPDVLLPDDDELFQKINSKLEPINNMFECVNAMSNDSRRFCLIDCSVGRYLKLNLLNAKGEQYLHIATDRVHNYYLNLVFPKYSVLTDSVNKYLMAFYEAGLIKKWEEYRFNDMKGDAPVKALGIEYFKGVYHVYIGNLFITCILFLMELLVGNYKKMKQYFILKVKIWKRTQLARKMVRLERKQNKIKSVSSSTQTFGVSITSIE